MLTRRQLMMSSAAALSAAAVAGPSAVFTNRALSSASLSSGPSVSSASSTSMAPRPDRVVTLRGNINSAAAWTGVLRIPSGSDLDPQLLVGSTVEVYDTSGGKIGAVVVASVFEESPKVS